MEIILAEYSGFCFGVKNAIKTTLKVLDKNDTIYSLGPIIHNNQVMNKMGNKGLKVIESINQMNNGKVIIRSHGVSLSTILEIKENNNIDIIDTTCPFVKKIQLRVQQYYNEGYQIVIIGSSAHVEVIGINGWCNNTAYIINSRKDVENMPNYDRICVVSQTTATFENFKEFSELIKLKGRDVKIFNTICNATRLRQTSCENLAKKVDAMIIIGGFHSSNTQKLAKISNKFCLNTYHIETAAQLPKDEFNKYEKIGITAGASTPDWIIEEVIEKMENLDSGMNEMMEAIEKTLIDIQKGDIVEGTIISINDNEIIVNIGYKSDGVIKRDELTNNPFVKLTDLLKIDEKINVYVLSLNDGEGNVVLSRKRVSEIEQWNKLEKLYADNQLIDIEVIEVVKGGLIALINEIKGFIPASHIALKYVDDLTPYLGKKLEVKIIEFDKSKRKIVLSRKIVEKNEIAQSRIKILDSLSIGEKIEGTVRRITNFGAFVDIGGIDGLIHISELSWGRIKHPSEIVKENDRVEVVVLDFNKEKGKISLGLKQNKHNPWRNLNERYKVNDIVIGMVTKLTNFGAFVEIESGLEGLVHISEISDERVNKVSDQLEKGQEVKVKILNINEQEQRISLSVKQAKVDEKENFAGYTKNEEEITIGEILNK